MCSKSIATRSSFPRLAFFGCAFCALFVPWIANAQPHPVQAPPAQAQSQPSHQKKNEADVNSGASSDKADPPPEDPSLRLQRARSANERRRRQAIENREFGDKEKIALLLNAHCDYPTKEDLLQTSANAESHLLEIIEDESILLSVRMRAVQALSYFLTPISRETLETILAHPNDVEHTLMLIHAIRSYTIIAPDAAPAIVEPFLASDSDFIRFVTINSLKNCPGDAALQVLQNRYDVETNRFFKMRLKQAIDNHCKNDAYCQ